MRPTRLVSTALLFVSVCGASGCSSGDDDQAPAAAPTGGSCWKLGENCDPSKGNCCDTEEVNAGCRDGTCQVCAVYQGECDEDADCCDGASCNSSGKCCSMGGCKEDADCCGQRVCGGVSCCLPSGASTTFVLDCCSQRTREHYDENGVYLGAVCQ